MSDLDILIPVYNEEDSVQELAKRIEKSFNGEDVRYNIIFIDDYSTDNTVKNLKDYIEKNSNGRTNGQVSKATKKQVQTPNTKVSAENTVYESNGQAHTVYEANETPKTNGEVKNTIYTNGESCIKILSKVGPQGKAYCILEAARVSKAPYVAMIDGDLQYPPEAIPEMYKLAQKHGVVVANRKHNGISRLRKTVSKTSRFLVGKLISGLDVDTQSGLKVMKREILNYVDESQVGAWSVDVPILLSARDLGHSIGTVDIDFQERKNGESKVNLLQGTAQIALGALKHRIKASKIYKIHPEDESGRGAGLAHKGRRFITHSDLPHQISAFHTFYAWQKAVLLAGLALFVAGLSINAIATMVVLIGILTFIYLLDFLFSIFVLLKSLHFPPEIKASSQEIEALKDSELPVYTILCPLYKEVKILPHFVEAINAIDWPKDKLDVQLLLEEDDKETINKAQELGLGDHFRILVVPHSQPKTKPKACNFGLAHAEGEYAVIYDAEDKPDPLQLKKAYLAFQKLSPEVVCLQSKLNYFNTDQNLLTRLFTAEYSLWFDLILPGLQSIETTIPLGGTSNHFKTKALRYLGGWDSFNVTEDCDLGARLFRHGYKTSIIDSVTLEEANSRVGSWLKQRSRWIKGYLQTYLVHMRDPVQFLKQNGPHAFLFQLVIGMRMAFILINPILWLMTISYFTLYPLVGPAIEALYPPVVFYPAVFLLVFGNFLYLYNYMIGAAKRRQWSVIKYVFLVPFYWIMTSIAAGIAFYQLFVKPHYWEKTEHGLHLEGDEEEKEDVPVEDEVQEPQKGRLPKIDWALNSVTVGGGALIGASILGNFSNFLYNAYLGRAVSLEEFGTVSLISSIFAISGIFANSIGKAVTYKSAKLFGQFEKPIKQFWSSTVSWTAVIAVLAVLVWVSLTPFLANFFNTESTLPFLLFSPAWAFVFLASVNKGFLSGNLKFLQFGIIAVVESVVKLGMAVGLVEAGYPQLVYAAIPASLIAAYIISLLVVSKIKEASVEISVDVESFPKGFFSTAVLTGLSTVAFLSFDVILAKHLLSPTAAGQYALISLTGKIIYFLGSLFGQFVTPLISHGEGKQKDTSPTFHKLLGATALISFAGYLVVGVFGSHTVPFLFGERANAIVQYLPVYGIALAGFAVSTVIINYHQVKNEYLFPVIGFLFALAQIVGIYMSPHTLDGLVMVVSSLAIAQLVAVEAAHIFHPQLQIVWRNLVDFAGIFRFAEANGLAKGKLRILVFNWRDTKHKWAGGAEVYVQEIAKRWVADGHKVTVFCGNDGENKRNENIDGVKIVRRGGFYTVFIWAAAYYIFKFRGKYDAIVDCENGVPFFTPLYSSLPKVLLIHHVHQEVHRKHLSFPLDRIAMFAESKLMPMIYQTTKFVTISESSKKDITDLGWAKKEDVTIVNPGINKGYFKPHKKTTYPSFLYLGRLQHYKNIDVAMRAFAKIYEKNKDAKFTIAGSGESRKYLEKLSKQFKLDGAVDFAGYVSEEKKRDLLAKSWAMIQPSSFEGWGITVIEANASGTPVIASKTKGLSDSVVDGKTGALVPIGDEDAIVEEMEAILVNKRYRERLAKNAYEWSKKFPWDHSAREFLSIVKKQIPKEAEDDAISRRFATTLRSLL